MQVTQITSQTTVVFKGNVPNHVLENPRVEVNKVSTIGLYVATFYYDSELDRLGFPIEVLDPSNNLLAQLRRTKSLSETIEGDVNAGQMDAEWLLNAVRSMGGIAVRIEACTVDASEAKGRSMCVYNQAALLLDGRAVGVGIGPANIFDFV